MEEKIIDKYNFRFNKNYGQNFIFDNNLLNAIVSDANLSKNDDVLEIGAGAGTLTKILALNCNKVVSYEIDKNLEPILKESLNDTKNVEVVFKDALKENIEDIESHFNGRYSLVANLPYYITTPLILKFLEETDNVNKIVVMVQKEVAERLSAKIGTKDYASITILLNFYGSVKILRNVSRIMFTPSPNVDSAILEISIDRNKFDCDKKMFSKIVRTCFSMRRKTIYNNLQKGFNESKEFILNWLNLCDIKPETRAEKLGVDTFVSLTNTYFDLKRQ